MMLEAKVTFVVDEKKTYTDALAILFSDMVKYTYHVSAYTAHLLPFV